jgi:hypothetical protein
MTPIGPIGPIGRIGRIGFAQKRIKFPIRHSGEKRESRSKPHPAAWIPASAGMTDPPPDFLRKARLI